MTAGRFLTGRPAVAAPLALVVLAGPLLLLVRGRRWWRWRWQLVSG